jgi:hypothetical protein
MLNPHSPQPNRRGMTVLTLLLLIIALIVGAILAVRYLRSRPQAFAPQPKHDTELLHQPFDQLNLSGVIEIVRCDTMDLLCVGPDSTG